MKRQLLHLPVEREQSSRAFDERLEGPSRQLESQLLDHSLAPSAALGRSRVTRDRQALRGEALEQLGGPCQEIIELRYFADLSYEEIARSLDLNMKTVSSRLSKCLDKLEAVAKALISREKKSPTSV